MSIIWIPVTESVPPNQEELVCIRTTEWRIPSGYCTGHYVEGHWYSDRWGVITGVTHWAKMEAHNG